MITQQQEKDLKEVFDKLPSSFKSEELGEVKMINYDLFRSMIETVIRESSYTQGYLDGFKSANEISDRVISAVFANH